MSEEKLGPGPLSHSSAQTLLGCEQKYYFYKVAKIEQDPDYVKSDALSIGSAFHHILEKSNHEKPALLRQRLKECEKDPDIRLPPDYFNLVHAMVLKYVRMHTKLGWKVLAVEFKLETEWFTGFVDAIMEDPKTNKWWIVDLKTYKSLYRPGLPALIRDPQLTLYAGHAPMIAEMFNLDMDKFGGCRWRVVTKSTAKQKPAEEESAYILRLVNENIKAYDVAVPVEKMDIPKRMGIHKSLYEKAQAMGRGEVEPSRNYGNCMAYFSPCQYWSKCMGANHSDMESSVDVYEFKK